MVILGCNGITKSFGIRLVLSDITMVLHEGERLGIVGVNGSGKTTLLKILSGGLEPDSGTVIFRKSRPLGYLSQVISDEPSQAREAMDTVGMDYTVYEEVSHGRLDLLELQAHLRSLEADMSSGQSEMDLAEVLSKYADAMSRYEIGGGHELEARVAMVLKGLGFEEYRWNQPVQSLSGGERTLIALGKLLVQEPEVLLLDEPTNHLDRRAVEWLEGYLSKYRGSVAVVSHDRYFLDRVVTRILEIEGCAVTEFLGNYSAYSEEKRMRALEQAHDYREQQKEITRLTVSMNRLYAWAHQVLSRSLKVKADNIKRRIDRLDKIPRPKLDKAMEVEYKPNRRSGEVVLVCEDVSVALEGKTIFSGAHLDLRYGRHIALVGPNGCGKSTLLRAIVGEIPVNSGVIRRGASVDIGYYDQRHRNIDLASTSLQELTNAANITPQRARGILGRFGLTGDKVFQRISDLSGGERSRLQLAKLMLEGANFLVLDEPTNHLDPKSVEAFEDALDAYEGTLLFVSHDRYFLNALADCVAELGPSGISLYEGNYDAYLEAKLCDVRLADLDPNPNLPEKPAKRLPPVTRPSIVDAEAESTRLSVVEGCIDELECRLRALEDLFAQVGCAQEAEYPQRCEEYAQCRSQLQALMEEWEALAGGITHSN